MALGCMIQGEPDPWKMHLYSALFSFPAESLVEIERYIAFLLIFMVLFSPIGLSHVSDVSFKFGVDFNRVSSKRVCFSNTHHLSRYKLN